MKRLLFLAATAAALLFSGCETPGDGDDNNQNNSENVDNGDNNNDNDNNNQDQDDNNGDNDYDEPLIQAPAPDSLLGTVWRTTVEYFEEEGETGTEVVTLFFDVDEPSQVFIMSQISDPAGNVIETNTITGTYTYEIPNITISYSVYSGDEEGTVNYILTGTVDRHVMTLSRKDSNGEVYTMTFTQE